MEIIIGSLQQRKLLFIFFPLSLSLSLSLLVCGGDVWKVDGLTNPLRASLNYVLTKIIKREFSF